MENVEKFMKVELYIDSTKQEQVNALSELLNTIGKNEGAKQEKRKCNKRQTDTPDPAPQPKKKDSTPEPEAPADEAKTYTIEEVREKLKEKVSEHRGEIKAKLGELGAPNVSNLDPEKYTEFVDFLNSLD
jgi:glucan-binding YG repeat protein